MVWQALRDSAEAESPGTGPGLGMTWMVVGYWAVPEAATKLVVAVAAGSGAAETVLKLAPAEALMAAEWSGPRPNLIRARESGAILVCQPWSPWNLSMAAWVSASHREEGSPVM